MKTIDDHFADWEAVAFGFGYGTGEEHVLPALRAFLAAVPETGCYDHERLGYEVTPTVAWLLINALCHVNAIEYGTSPRCGWLTECGREVQAYVTRRSNDALYENCTSRGEEYAPCYPDHCNCDDGPCVNPFWEKKR